MPTVAVVIIGREILTGKFADENGPYFIRRLRALGAQLTRLVTVDDDVASIADEVRRCAAQVDHVFTTGGVGPTHDDLTFEGVARAFGRGLVLEPALVELMARYAIPRSAANDRMAMLPAGSELIDGHVGGYPIVRCENVWILPGVPRLMQQKFEVIAPRLRGPTVYVRRLLLGVHETDIADALTAIAAAHGEVEIGSYPRFGEGDVRLILTLESRSPLALDAADQAISDVMPVIRRVD